MAVLFFMVAFACLLTGCGNRKKTSDTIAGLTYVSTDQNEDAEEFRILRYKDAKGTTGYSCLSFSDGGKYLIIPENGTVPEALKKTAKTVSDNQDAFETKDGLVVLRQPVNNIYLAATAAMSHFATLDAMDHLKFTGTRQNDWYIDEAREAMKKGSLLFAGKYSEPDYETLMKYHTSLALESTMIRHTPEVREKLVSVGIPVMTDLSSYESTPFGRAEWIKVYGVLLGKEKQADAFFEKEKEEVRSLDRKTDSGTTSDGSGKTVAFFYLDSQGRAIVRKSDDYIPEMIQMAGGQYIFKNLKNRNPDSHSGTVTMSVEQFYQGAADADILIYDAVIEEPLKSIDDLTKKNEIFKKFRAVRENHVWCAEASMYQSTDSTAEIIEGFHEAVTGGSDTEFLRKVE